MSTIVEFQRRYRRCECGDALNHQGNHAKPLRRQPVWVQRMQQNQTKAKDMTGWRPEDAA